MYDPAKYNLKLDNIPAWMRPTYRGIDWSLLAVLAVSLVIALPLATRTGMPPSPQAETELYRIVEVATMLEAGQLYPRWAPNFNFGYGSPIFNHVAPLPHYAGGVYVALIQEQPHVAVKALMVGAILTLGVATFGFLRRRFGELAAMWGTAVLLMSPYLLMTLTAYNTDLGLLWAMAALMLTLWMLDRTISLHRGRDLVALVFSSTLLLLSHTSLGPLLFLWAYAWAALVLLSTKSEYWRMVAIGLALSVGLAAFYWLPAVIDQTHYQWQALNGYPVTYDTTTLLKNPPLIDRNAMNAPTELYLGVATWLWAVVGGAWWLWHSGLQWRNKLFEAVQIDVLLFVLVGVGTFLYLYNNPSPAHGFMALTSVELTAVLLVACTVMSAQLGTLLERRLVSFSRRFLALSILLGILCISAANSVYVPVFMSVDTTPTSTEHFTEELRGTMFGSFQNGHLLPTSVHELPPPLSELSRDLQSLPPSTRVTIHNPVHVTYEIESAGAQTFTLLVFDYPGWQVNLNDQRITPDADEQTGLINVELRDGYNRLDLRFRETSFRTLSWVVSGLALLSTIIAAILIERRSVSNFPDVMTADSMRTKREHQRMNIFIALVLCGFLAVAYFNPHQFSHNTPSDAIPRGVNVLDVLVSGVRQNGVSLLGYQLGDNRVSPEESVLLKLYWRANGGRVDPYQINLLLFQNGQEVQRTSYRHIGMWPTRRWSIDRYVSGTFSVPAPSTPGTYQLVLEMGPCNHEGLEPCETIILSDIYDLRGPIGQQLLLPEPIIVYN